MTKQCPHLKNIAALALDCIDDDDCDGLYAHLETCESCTAIYIEHLRVVTFMMSSYVEIKPSDGCRQRVLDVKDNTLNNASSKAELNLDDSLKDN